MKTKYETPEYAKFTRRILKAYGTRVADADEVDLGEMLEIMDEFEQIVAGAIAGQLSRGRSWTYLATAAKVSRQGMRQRWSAKIAALTE